MNIDASTEQRRMFHALIEDLAAQLVRTKDGAFVHWQQDPAGQRFSKKTWRGMVCAIVLNLPVIENMEYGNVLVIVSESSRDMDRAQYSEAISLADAIGTTRGVVWTAPKEHPK